MSWQVLVALAAFVIAALLFTGVIALRDDAVGRIIYGSTWIVIGLMWLGRRRQAR